LKTDKTTTPEPLTFIDALDQTQIRYRAHPHFKKLEGTPWENDAAVIAADMMVNAVKDHLSRIQELEDQVKALRDVGGVMAGILTKHAADVGVRDLGEVEAVTAWDNLTASKPSNNNTGS